MHDIYPQFTGFEFFETPNEKFVCLDRLSTESYLQNIIHYVKSSDSWVAVSNFHSLTIPSYFGDAKLSIFCGKQK